MAMNHGKVMNGSCIFKGTIAAFTEVTEEN
jgi:hypothetical protein